MSTTNKVLLPSEPELQEIFQEAQDKFLNGVPNPYKPAVVYITVAVGDPLESSPNKAEYHYRYTEGPVYAGDALFSDFPFYRLPYFICKGFTSRDGVSEAATKLRKELDDVVLRDYRHTRYPLSRRSQVGPPTNARLEEILSKRPLKPGDFEYRTYEKPYGEAATDVARKTLRDTLDGLKKEAVGTGDLYNDKASRGAYADDNYDQPQIDLYNRLREVSATAAAKSPFNNTGYPQRKQPAGFGFGGGSGLVGLGGLGYVPGISSTNIQESAEASATIQEALNKLAQSAYASRKPNPGSDDHQVARDRIRAFLASPQGDRLLSKHRSR